MNYPERNPLVYQDRHDVGERNKPGFVPHQCHFDVGGCNPDKTLSAAKMIHSEIFEYISIPESFHWTDRMLQVLALNLWP